MRSAWHISKKKQKIGRKIKEFQNRKFKIKKKRKN